MVRIKKYTRKAKFSRERVSLHRDVQRIMNREIETVRSHINSLGNSGSSTHEKCDQSRNSNKFDRSLNSQEQLRRWALKYNISKRAIDELLKILIAFGMSYLPKCSKTLLSTPRSIEMTTLTQGKLWYNGIAKNLKMIFGNLHTNFNINLCFNMDGLPLFNSSKWQFWPILANIHGKIETFE